MKLFTLSYIYWDPKAEIFTIPVLDIPIVWYGVFFASGFAIGYAIFALLVRRYLMLFPKYTKKDINSWSKLFKVLTNSKDKVFLDAKKKFSKEAKYKPNMQSALIKLLNELLQKTDSKASLSRKRILLDQKLKGATLSFKKKASVITDRMLIYVVIATVVGARLGHFLFYEKPSTYLQNPLGIINLWEDGQFVGITGLASHGAIIAIIIAVVFLARSIKKYTDHFNWIKLLDFACVPAMLAGGLIRIGNFVNQEILGTETDVPWAVIFGSPVDYSAPIPRHPVQLYEALFYFLMYAFLMVLSLKKKYLLAKGKILGIFLVLVFSFRFFIEFFKQQQSYLLEQDSLLNMGQYLSIPIVILGILIFFYEDLVKSKKNKNP